MEEGQGIIQQYLDKFIPIKQLPRGPVLTEEEAIRWLIDEAFRASRQMIKTHQKNDIVRFIILAQVLDTHGYAMQWAKHKGVVGATRKTLEGPIVIGASKEVQRYADRAHNASVIANSVRSTSVGG